jgi:5-methylcytosine-specific restriction protein A
MSNPHWPAGWPKLRRTVLERDAWRCQLQYPGCLGRATQADHRIPRVHGGPDALWNLQAACGPCNVAKGDGTRPVARAVSAW